MKSSANRHRRKTIQLGVQIGFLACGIWIGTVYQTTSLKYYVAKYKFLETARLYQKIVGGDHDFVRARIALDMSGYVYAMEGTPLWARIGDRYGDIEGFEEAMDVMYSLDVQKVTRELPPRHRLSAALRPLFDKPERRISVLK